MTLEQFDGPLDLMLHLIRENKLDLLNLDVNALTDQYIAYLNSMETLHLEIASEYLVEMAILIEYKSRKMLPGNKDRLEAEDEDPQKTLVRRLLEYQKFKDVSSDLAQMFENRQKKMGKPLSSVVEEWMVPVEDGVFHGSAYELMKAMKRCMRRLRLTMPLETRYTVKEISMEDRELEVRARLATLPKTFSFDTLVDDCHDLPKFIVTFLAVLDLARQHVLYFTIDEKETIWFTRGEQVNE